VFTRRRKLGGGRAEKHPDVTAHLFNIFY
jgi:hypothetical protein